MSESSELSMLLYLQSTRSVFQEILVLPNPSSWKQPLLTRTKRKALSSKMSVSTTPINPQHPTFTTKTRNEKAVILSRSLKYSNQKEHHHPRMGPNKPRRKHWTLADFPPTTTTITKLRVRTRVLQH